VLVLIAALIPVGEAIHATGGADLVAKGLSQVFGAAPPLVALALVMLLAMISAPFMHNAPTVLVFAPIAVGLARQLHLNADPFLMSVAVGAACDFLTPIGHQCNTLVMAPGGYRFADYPRLGAPAQSSRPGGRAAPDRRRLAAPRLIGMDSQSREQLSQARH